MEEDETLQWREKLHIACMRNPPYNKDTAYICSRHFEPDLMSQKGEQTRLDFAR